MSPADPSARPRANDLRERTLLAALGPRRPFQPFRLAAASALLPLAFAMGVHFNALGYAPTLNTLTAAMLRAAPLAALFYPLLIAIPEQTLSAWEDLTLSARALTATCALAVATLAILAFNANFDRTLGIETAYPILAKYYVDRSDGPKWPAIDIAVAPAGSLRVAIDEIQYRGIEIGKSHFLTRLHPGAFGLPWFERDVYRIEPAR